MGHQTWIDWSAVEMIKTVGSRHVGVEVTLTSGSTSLVNIAFDEAVKKAENARK